MLDRLLPYCYPSTGMDSGCHIIDTELAGEFLAETKEHLAEVEEAILALNTAIETPKKEPINRIMRSMHSIKGSAGFLGYEKIVSLAHNLEAVLKRISAGEIEYSTAAQIVLLGGVDKLNLMIADLTHHESIDVQEIQQQLTYFLAQPSIDNGGIGKPLASNHCNLPQEREVESKATADAPFVTPEMVERFQLESMEMFDNLEQCLLDLEESKSNSSQTLYEAFRLIHSFKGNCGFLGLQVFAKFAHDMEDVLCALKEGSLKPTSDLVVLLLQCIDALRIALHKQSENHVCIIENQPDLQSRLKHILGNKVQANTPLLTKIDRPQNAPADSEEPRAALNPLPMEPKSIRQDVRVDLNKLDMLINLVGELIIAEAMVIRNPRITSLEDEQLERSIHLLQRLSLDLQDVAMSVRMFPLSTTFRKLNRLVHDLSQRMGKEVRLDLVGEETEVDKTILEKIGDPLVHMVRNAIDHGLEKRQEREASGKAAIGNITIEAKNEGGEIQIVVRDDGGGINRAKVIKRAQETGLLKGNADKIQDAELYQLIFEPGFSIAEKVTDVSGRGVGLDVVKKNIEQLKGRIHIHSVLGQGTTFTLHIPLTLAIIDAMLVRVGKAYYSIPLLSIKESFRPHEGQIHMPPDGSEVVKIRESLYPILRLHAIFRQKADTEDPTTGILIVTESDGQTVCLFVDEIIGQQQTVIKPLSPYLKSVRGISGCTILGDGTISLILDIASLIKFNSRQATL